MSNFIHLHVHTAYSLSEGAIHVKDLVKQCVGHAMPAVAVTDRNNMFAGLEFSVAASEAGVQPIIGVSLDVVESVDGLQVAAHTNKATAGPLVLLAQNEDGYLNLMRTISRAHLEKDAADGVAFPLKDLEGLAEGLICLTGGVDGLVGQALVDQDADKARGLLTRLKTMFDDRLYMELQRHGRDDEKAIEEDLLDLAYELDLPIVATNEPYFVKGGDYEAHDTLLCMADSTYVSEQERRRLNADYRFKTADEMVDLFKDLPEAIENTVNIAQRCAYMVPRIDPLLPNFVQGMDESEEELLRKMVQQGLEERLQQISTDHSEEEDWQAAYWSRMDHELKIINQMGFPGYFLIVADFIQWAKDHDVPVGPGRGSGAGSLVAWALKITDLDPLRFSLLFERFLNPERVSMPDFDIDFCQEKRDRVISYVQDKYGHDKVAQIITFGKLQARAVVKACGRVLQQPYPVTDRLSKLIPNDPGNAMSLQEALDYEPRLRQEIEDDELTRTVMDRALKLEGLYAHSSTHAAGVVIGDRPLDRLVPLYRDPKSDMPVTQFNMKWVEQAGLVKFDFLGLKTLTVLDRAVRYVRQRGIDIDLETVPLDDPATYKLLSSGDAAGVFQLESSGMRSVLKGLKPDSFEDIIAIVALYRPGPMDNIPTYINRKHGREEVEYPHQVIEEILSETYGVIIYQEQVMQIAQVMSGYSLGEADLLRRAMGKKIKEEMDKQRGRFCDGAVERGIAAEKASEIFDLVTKFASYGFNKSHAAAYALVAYHTAFMKANFPVEFMAATMSLDRGNTDKLGFFKQELQRMGVPLLPPDINASGVNFVVEAAPETYTDDVADPRANLAVRYALGAVKGVGAQAMRSVIEARTEGGAFPNPFDFAERVNAKLLNKRQLEQLSAAGAFDSLVPNRAQAYAAADIVMRYAQLRASEQESAQVSLFEQTPDAVDRPVMPIVKDWTDSEQLEAERKAVGFYISAHPLDSYDKILRRENIVTAAEVLGSEAHIGTSIKMAGAISGYREGQAKKSGRPFGSLSLSDQTDVFEILVFEDGLEQVRMLVERGAPLVARVQVRKRPDDDMVRLSAQSLESLEDVAASSETGLEIEVSGERAFAGMREALSRSSGGKGVVSVRVQLPDARTAVFKLPDRYKVTPELRQAIAAEMDVTLVEEI